ncbi:hypothetical protein NMK54_16535 [Nocardia otitidiscaviarum]|uniref:hypothetical protein n=1 Tax=Nocardia otitidiscaviarum TaxID=1823 RepID=UPI00163D6D5C|nr:hypothetical protein [Nocardia otitidiscaviarum]MCP9621765.1 hypothetical protein [Nocardia otitidiscaviarum]
MSGGWIVLGWIIVFGLPSAVLVAVVWWPERIPKDRTVEAIRQRIEDEDEPPTA